MLLLHELSVEIFLVKHAQEHVLKFVIYELCIQIKHARLTVLLHAIEALLNER